MQCYKCKVRREKLRQLLSDPFPPQHNTSYRYPTRGIVAVSPGGGTENDTH